MRASRLMLIPAVLALTGCMQGTRLIKLNADGSGSIVDTVKLSEQARGMMASMQEMDKSTPAEKKAKKDAKLKTQMAAMGEGVTLVSNVTDKDGTEKTIYAFRDISKIKLDTTPSSSDSGESTGKEDPLTFRLARNGANSLLTVVIPKDKPSGDPAKPKAAPKPEEEQQAIAMMKSMLAGLKISTQVEVNGKVVKTTSPWAAGPVVTLMEIDFDQIDPAGLKKLAASGADKPSADQLKGLKGLKVQEGEVTIEFAGK
jgi:hypothetical protein